MKRWGKCTEIPVKVSRATLPEICHTYGNSGSGRRDGPGVAGTGDAFFRQRRTVVEGASGRVSPLVLVVLAALGVSLPLAAAILPEDRSDVMYHRYDGGGVTIDGPSVLVRKQLGQSLSVSANANEDSVTSASIDVVTTASPYTEQRDEKRLGLDYLHGNTTMNLTLVNSVESDYTANTFDFSLSHDMFGDLTTVTLGYGRGFDDVGQNVGGTRVDKGKTNHYKYRVGLSQILTKNMVVSGTLELDTDEGFLNNPYRSVLVIKRDLSGAILPSDSGFNVFENYPRTHTSTALGLVAKYYLPYRAAVKLGYRTYGDTWDVTANMYEIGYTQPLKSHWTFDFSFRTYSQTQASFYGDTFEASSLPFYRARDKELSAYGDKTVGMGVSYEFGRQGFWLFDKGTLNFNYSRIKFDYQNFTDQRKDPTTNVRPLLNGQPYSFSADVFRFFVSVWY